MEERNDLERKKLALLSEFWQNEINEILFINLFPFIDINTGLTTRHIYQYIDELVTCW